MRVSQMICNSTRCKDTWGVHRAKGKQKSDEEGRRESPKKKARKEEKADPSYRNRERGVGRRPRREGSRSGRKIREAP